MDDGAALMSGILFINQEENFESLQTPILQRLLTIKKLFFWVSNTALHCQQETMPGKGMDALWPASSPTFRISIMQR